MADEWPFLHLNMISPHVEQLPASTDNQELSLLPFDPSHLEAWTNITFQFDEPNVLFNPPPSTGENQNSNSPTDNKTLPAIGHELFHSSPELQFQLPNDHNVPSFVDSKDLISPSSNPHHLTYLDRTSNQTSNHAIDTPANNNLTKQSSIQAYHQSTTSKNIKSKQAEDNTPPTTTSPNNQQTTSNHGSNDDDADNRIAYDEDKRRRNTLASARFRMKKKMKEQEIERTAREMRDRVSELEKEVDSLKQENKWLRGLIVDSTASKLVSVQTKETGELNHVESCTSSNKRANPVPGLPTDSIGVPNYPQKRLRMGASPTTSTATATATATTVHSSNTCNFSPPPFSR